MITNFTITSLIMSSLTNSSEASLNKYVRELYILCEECDNLKNKICMKKEPLSEYDKDVVALKIVNSKIRWISEKAGWVR